jgi:superfamily II DNA helicase RecQ
LTCVAIDEAHLVEDWKDFRKEYGRLGWFRQYIAREIPFLAVSATLDPKAICKLRDSVSFRPGLDTHIIKTSIDRPEIFINIQSIKRPASSFLDLSTILPDNVTSRHMIPKTVIFIDSRSQIQEARQKIVQWMKVLQYPPGYQDWVRPYFASMDGHTKDEIAKDFGKEESETNRSNCAQCRILVASVAYGMGIDNPDIERIHLWGAPKSTTDLLQRLGRAMRKGNRQAYCTIFVPSWYFDNRGSVTEVASVSSPGRLGEEGGLGEEGAVEEEGGGLVSGDVDRGRWSGYWCIRRGIVKGD